MSNLPPRVKFSWEEPAEGAASQALAVRRHDHEQVVVAFHQKKKEEQKAIDEYQKQLDSGKQLVLDERAKNRLDTNKLRNERAKLEANRALVQRDREKMQLEMQELHTREEESKRNRTASMIFIEDRFSALGAREVLEYLTHSSTRIRDHTMKNTLFCICGTGQMLPSYVQFNVSDAAPFLLAKLDQLLSARNPGESVQQFAETVVTTPAMAKALAAKGQCSKLAEFMIRNNAPINSLAIAAFTQMMQMDAQVITAVYTALQAVISQIPLSDSPSGSAHPAEVYVTDLTPNIIRDCYNNGRWSLVDPLVLHKSDMIRQAALDQIVTEASKETRVRQGLFEVKTIYLLEHFYESPEPPGDVITFFTKLLPLLAPSMCRQRDDVHWLISRINDPTPQIPQAVMRAIRIHSTLEDPAILQTFVSTELLRRLQETTAQDTVAITGLIRHLLPLLALPHTRTKDCSRIISFLDHAENEVAKACLTACDKILASTPENRADLYAEISRLNFSKESTLRLCDRAMPILCEDWAAAGDFARVLKYLSHPQERVRRPAHEVWKKVISSSSSAPAKVAHDGHLGVVFELCGSEYDDCVDLGSFSLPFLAVEIARAGPDPTRQLIRLFDRPQEQLRQAVLLSTQTITEGGATYCEVLFKADILDILKLSLQRYTTSRLDIVQKILRSLAPLFSKSHDACCGLLQLLNCNDPEQNRAVSPALDWIAVTSIEDRAILRNAIMENLQFASDNLVEYSGKAIRHWIGPDLIQLGQPQLLFYLASHPDIRIQNSALSSLKQSVHNKNCHESLQREGIVPLLHSLLESGNPEATDFVATALRSLGLTLARHGHVDEIFTYISHEDSSVQDGACAAIESVANGSTEDRRRLLNDGLLERLIRSSESLGPSELRLASAIIPRLTAEYIHTRKVAFIVNLVNHRQEPIRIAAISAVDTMAEGTDHERRTLRDALLPLLGGASAALVDVASKCLGQALARDLLVEGEYKQVFSLLQHENDRIREPVVSALQYHIQSSSAVARKKLVDAGILNALLQALSNSDQDRMVTFTVDCVLPSLGPFFTQNDGGGSLTPLLRHDNPRIRTSAATAIKNAVDSPHGNLENVASSGIISHLHASVDDANIRDLLCHLVPKIAPFITNTHEIDILFEDLSRPAVRLAASTAINIMAKASDSSRQNLFTALLNQLDGPPAAAVETIANALSLLGSVFVWTGNEYRLLEIIEYGDPTLSPAAAEAVIRVLERGNMIERQRLMDANVFGVSLNVHKAGSDQRTTLRLLNSIIRTLNHLIILDEGNFEQLLCLFDDPDPTLTRTLCESLADLAGGGRLTESTRLMQLFPLLLDRQRQRKADVVRLLVELAPFVMQKLLQFRMVPFIARLLMAERSDVAEKYLYVLHTELYNASESDKELLVGESEFLSALLQDRNTKMDRMSTEILGMLSNKSLQRSAKLMDHGVGSWLLNGKHDIKASLTTARTLYLTAPADADQLVEESLPIIYQCLKNTQLHGDVHRSCLNFLDEIVKQTPHDIIVEMGVVEPLVAWLNPQHSVVDAECRRYVYEICQLIAQRSDLGRQALISQGILPVLIQLSASQMAYDVVNSCKILKSLAHSGTYRSELLAVGVKVAMDRITGLFHKSTLTNKHEKAEAHKAAKEVLLVLQSTKQGTLPVQPMNSGFQRSNTAMFAPLPRAAPVEPRITSWSLNSRGNINHSGYQQEAARTASDVNLNENVVQDNRRRTVFEQVNTSEGLAQVPSDHPSPVRTPISPPSRESPRESPGVFWGSGDSDTSRNDPWADTAAVPQRPYDGGTQQPTMPPPHRTNPADNASIMPPSHMAYPVDNTSTVAPTYKTYPADHTTMMPPTYRTHSVDNTTMMRGRMRRTVSEDVSGLQRSGTRNTFGLRPPQWNE